MCSQPVFSGKPEGPFCLSCTFIFQNERNWMKKSASGFRKTPEGKSGLTWLTGSYRPDFLHTCVICWKDRGVHILEIEGE